MPPMMTKKQLANFLGVSPRTVDTFRKVGLLHSVKVRRTIRFPSPAVSAFLRQHQELPAF